MSTQAPPAKGAAATEAPLGDAESAVTAPRPHLARHVYYLEASALLGLTVALILVFSLLPATRDTFPTLANLQATIGSQSVLAMVAIAALIPLICGQYDFSVGATMGLASVYAATVLSSGAPIVVALLLAIGIGSAVGVVNGALVTRLRVSSVVTTLGTAVIIRGIVTAHTSGVSILSGIPSGLTDFGTGTFLGIPRTAYVAIAIALIISYVLSFTPYGRYTQAVGSNTVAARLVGLPVNRLTWASFIFAGAIAGAAGLLQVAVSGGGNPQVGDNFTLPAIAAAFLSVAAIKPGRFNVWGTMVAILFLASLNSGLNLAGASSYVNDFANGTALICGVALAGLFGRHRAGQA